MIARGERCFNRVCVYGMKFLRNESGSLVHGMNYLILRR